MVFQIALNVCVLDIQSSNNGIKNVVSKTPTTSVILKYGSYQPTVFVSVPIGSMLIWITSPFCNVNSDGGIIPVPVMR